MGNNYNLVTEYPGLMASDEQIARLYHRYRFAVDYSINKMVLEVACGSGIGLGYLATKANKVVGLDIDAKNVDLVEELYGINANSAMPQIDNQFCGKEKKIEIYLMDAHALDLSDNTFDSILLLEALYYLKDPFTFFTEANRVLIDEGTLVISTVNKDWAAFHPSPYTYRYFSVPELYSILNKCFAKVELFGAFSVKETGFKNSSFSGIKKIAVQLNLIPNSLTARAFLKRIFMGPLKSIPNQIYEGMAPYEPPVPIPFEKPNFNYKIIYAVAQKL